MKPTINVLLELSNEKSVIIYQSVLLGNEMMFFGFWSHRWKSNARVWKRSPEMCNKESFKAYDDVLPTGGESLCVIKKR